MRSKLIVSLIVAGIFGVGYGLYYLAHHRPASFPEPAGTAPVPVSAPATGAAARPVSAATSAEVQSFRAAPPVERVKAFYRAESARVGEVDADPKLTEERLTAVAQELQPAEISWLKEQALDGKQNADARFFAAYLLALGAQEAAMPGLKEIASAPIAKSKREGEEDLARQIRAQAIEGLCRMPDKVAARDAVMDVEQKQNDEFLRDRAHRCLYALASGKPIEEQDKEAAGKLLYGK